MGTARSVLSTPQSKAQLCLPFPLRQGWTVHPLPVVCPTAQLPTPAGKNQAWLTQILVVLFSFDYIQSFLQVKSLAAQFRPALQAHLSLAFQDLQLYSQSGSCGPEAQHHTLSRNEVPGSLEQPRELFQVLLQSLEEASPSRHLLQEALVLRCPTLAVLAACQQVNTATGIGSV